MAGLPQPHLAYLTSQYPATSHTFISREVAAVRQLGLRLDTLSIRPPSSEEIKDEAARAEAESTFTVLKRPASQFASAHLTSFVRQPLVYLRTLALALRHRPPGARGLALSLAHFAEAILLSLELRRRGVDRLHNHFANSAATVGFLATRMLRMPWSFTMHGISETDYPAGLLLGRKIEAADFVACVSYFGRAQAMRLVQPSHWNKLHVVRCGLFLDTLPKATKRSGKRIVCVGRLSPEKGHAGLLEAFSLVAEDHPDAELRLVGDGPEDTALREMVERLGLSERVRFTGRLGEGDTLNEIAQADLLVVPSFMEGLPIVLMEAMAVGTSVVASRVAGIPELVSEGQTGLLFTPSRWDELADCMRRLISDQTLRQRLAKAARTKIALEFDIHRSAEQLETLFAGSSK